MYISPPGLPFLPSPIAGVTESFGKWVMVDFQLGYLKETKSCVHVNIENKASPLIKHHQAESTIGRRHKRTLGLLTVPLLTWGEGVQEKLNLHLICIY